MTTTRKGRRADSAASLGEMEYVDALGLWVYVGGTKGPGKTPTIQPDGTVQWQLPAGGVTSFNSRTGAVAPAAGDYAVADITGLSTALAGKQAAFGSQSANAVYAGPTSGGAAAPAFRALVAADIPSFDAAKITSGVLAIGRLATGTPDGTKFVRDDGTLATPTASVGWRYAMSRGTIANGNYADCVSAAFSTPGAVFLVDVTVTRLAFRAAAHFVVPVQDIFSGSGSWGIVRAQQITTNGAVIGLEAQNSAATTLSLRVRNDDTLNFDTVTVVVTCLSENAPTFSTLSATGAISTTALWGQERIRLAAIEQGAATSGQALVWNNTSKTFAPVTLGYADIVGAAPLASPAFTGTPTVPTAGAGTNTTQAASTAFVTSAVSSFGGTIQGSSIRCLLRNSANVSASTTNAFTPIPYDTEDADTDTMHSLVSNTGRITIVTAGTYLFTACWQSTVAYTGLALSALRLNGATRLGETAVSSSANGVSLSTSQLLDLSAGDYVEHCYYLTATTTIAAGSRFCATKIA
jgi:hypothetical protein